eukprot:5555706-Pyramimonas_sp.AAC.1
MDQSGPGGGGAGAKGIGGEGGGGGGGGRGAQVDARRNLRTLEGRNRAPEVRNVVVLPTGRSTGSGHP